MKMVTYFGAVKPLIFWLVLATIALSAVVQANPNETFVSQDILPLWVLHDTLTRQQRCRPAQGHRP